MSLRCPIVLVVLVGCAPSMSAVKQHVSAGHALLDRKEFIAAEREFRIAEAKLYDEPSDRAAQAVQDGLARVDAGLIQAAIESSSKVAGRDLEAIAELHRLHLRLRSIGGNPELEAEIAKAINIRASLLMAPHEASSTITDVTPVLALGRYPELDDGSRRRLSALSARAWKAYDARASLSAHPLVKRTFEGLAAHYSGAAVTAATALRDTELSQYSRGSTVKYQEMPNCPSVGTGLTDLSRTGAYQVDAEVRLDACEESDTTSSRQESETYEDQIPYEVQGTYMEQQCFVTKVPVSYCINPYTRDGCVGSSDTVAGYECQMVPRSGTFIRYRSETKTRMVTRTTRYQKSKARMWWRRSFQGRTEELTADIETIVIDGKGEPFVVRARKVLEASLDEPVQATIDQRASELRAAGDAQLAAGRPDDAELAFLRAVYLGRSGGDYFARTYAVTDERLRASLDARTAGAPGDRAESMVALPSVTDERRDEALTFVRDRFASTFPPALSRVKGLWYNAELGAISAPTRALAGDEVGGGTAPTFGLRLGTPVLGRIHRRTGGFAVWDDLAVGGNLGYTASTPRNGERGVAVRGVGTYTATVGFRARAIQLLGGARATASAIKIGGTTGHTSALSYYGNLGIRIGGPSLVLEVWAPTPSGAASRGAQLFFAAQTPQSQHSAQRASAGPDIMTSYASVRIDDERYDACVAAATGCADIADYRILTVVLAFGAAFR